MHWHMLILQKHLAWLCRRRRTDQEIKIDEEESKKASIITRKREKDDWKDQMREGQVQGNRKKYTY